MQIQYREKWWNVTNQHNGYLTIERGGRSMTISHKLVTDRRDRVPAKRQEPEVCRRCLTRHRSFEWCRSR